MSGAGERSLDLLLNSISLLSTAKCYEYPERVPPNEGHPANYCSLKVNHLPPDFRGQFSQAGQGWKACCCLGSLWCQQMDGPAVKCHLTLERKKAGVENWTTPALFHWPGKKYSDYELTQRNVLNWGPSNISTTLPRMLEHLPINSAAPTWFLSIGINRQEDQDKDQTRHLVDCSRTHRRPRLTLFTFTTHPDLKGLGREALPLHKDLLLNFILLDP